MRPQEWAALSDSLRGLVERWRLEAARLRLGSSGTDATTRVYEDHANELAALLAAGQGTVADSFDPEVVAEEVVHKVLQRRLAGGSEGPVGSEESH